VSVASLFDDALLVGFLEENGDDDDDDDDDVRRNHSVDAILASVDDLNASVGDQETSP
jgi:hypothetical protein